MTTSEGVRRGDGRRELTKRGRGMKDSVHKSMGIVTLMTESLTKINPTESLRLDSSQETKLLRYLR